MAKFIVFSDLHCHNYRDFDRDGSRLAATVDVLGLVFTKAAEYKADAILFCGDLFERQGHIPTSVLNAVHQKFQQCFSLLSIPFIAISGNHDQSTKNTIPEPAESALEFLAQAFEQFILLDYYPQSYHFGTDTSIYGIPYYDNPEHFLDSLDTIIKDGIKSNSILLIHQTPKSDVMEYAYDFDPMDDRFLNFGITFCGHIHQRKMYPESNLCVLGNPLHKDRGDEGSSKGIYFYDSEIAQLKIIRTNYPEFKTLKAGDTLPDQFHYYSYAPDMEKADERIDSAFTTDLKPENLLTNYFLAKGETNKALLEFGLKLLAE